MKRYNEFTYKLEIDDILSNINGVFGIRKERLNYYKMPITAYKFNEENVKLFNHIVSCLYGSDIKKIKRTPSGGVSLDNLDEIAYDVRAQRGSIEITIINYFGKSFRLQWRNSASNNFDDTSLKMCGHQAFSSFRDVCRVFDIDLSKYAHLDYESALKEKNEIEPSIIRVVSEKFLNRTFENVHHIDRHSSYMSGLVNTHPEFKDVVEYIYEHRKDDDIKFKSILNMTQGYMQSSHCKYKYAHLSRDMIKNNNDWVRNTIKSMLSKGIVPLLINTDGIWYTGEMYHDGNEGSGICTWGHDHTNCTFRIKSAGAYEYIENGVYHPVVRGQTKLDLVKDRKDWLWGDIYEDNCKEIIYTFRDGYIYIDDELKGAVEYE